MLEFVQFWSDQKIKQLEVEGARVPVPHSWRRQSQRIYYTVYALLIFSWSDTSSYTFRRLLKTQCLHQAFSSHYWLSQFPWIRPLVDSVHFKGFYLLTCLLTCCEHRIWSLSWTCANVTLSDYNYRWLCCVDMGHCRTGTVPQHHTCLLSRCWRWELWKHILLTYVWTLFFYVMNWSAIATHLVVVLVGRRSSKTPKAPSFQIGWGWNLAGLFLE